MNYKELYLGTQDRRYVEITGIKKEGIFIEGKPIDKIKENWIVILAIFAIVIGVLLINFRATYFFVSLGLMVLLAVLYIFGNRYTVTCEKKGILIKQGISKNNIEYSRIKNVFVNRTRRGLFFKTYVLVIRCEDNFSFLREFEYPLLCTDSQQILDFVCNFNLATQSNSRYVKFEKKKFLRRIVEHISTAVCVIIILWYMFSAGIINIF